MRHLLTYLILFTALSASARQISPAEAQAEASKFFSAGSDAPQMKSAIRMATGKAYPAESQPFYVFNAPEGKGFVIISGDTRARKILGYSHESSLDFENIPPQLSWLLDQYARQISSLVAAAVNDESWSVEQSTDRSDAVLLQTASWGQGYPFNAGCPVVAGEHAMAGCVATAMSTVMKYHQWPDKGRGAHKYKWDYIADTELSADFGNTEYKFDLMPDRISGSESPEAVDALATLSYHAGIAVNMKYSSQGSGASCFDVPTALKQFFKYDKSCQYIQRRRFNDEQWHSLIRKQLDEGHPVIYEGYNSEVGAGHAWVLDGYTKDDEFYHFNWGWDGAGNGFLTLSATNNEGYATYPEEQAMVINIIPDRAGSDFSPVVVEYPYRLSGDFELNVGLRVSVQDIEPGVPFDISVNQLFFPPGFVGEYGFAIKDAQNNIREILWQMNVDNSYVDIYTVPQFSAISNVVSGLESINDDDRLCIVTMEDGQDVWKFVEGTIEAPAEIPVHGNQADLTTIHFNTDNDISVSVAINGPAWEEAKATPYNKSSFSCLSGAQVKFRLEVPRGGMLTFDVDGYFNGGIIDNRIILDSFTENEYNGMINSNKKEYHITANISAPLTLSIANEKAGELRTKLTKEQARCVKELSLSGPLNVYDIWYINDYCQSLIKIDMKGATFEECEMPHLKSDFFEYLYNVNMMHRQHQLPDWCFMELARLNGAVLPDNLKYIGNNAFFDSRLKTLVIPASVEEIGANFMSGYGFTESVTCLNTTPPNIAVSVGHFCDSDFRNATLYVPDESVELYKSHQIWGKFENIKGVSSGVSIVTAKEDTCGRIYTLSGILVFDGNLSEANPPKGIYIVVTAEGSYKKYVE